MKHLALLLFTLTGFALQGCSDNPDPRPPTSSKPANSSSSQGTYKPSAAQGKVSIQGVACSACHVDKEDGTFEGPYPFDVNNLLHVSGTGKDELRIALASYIETEMPKTFPEQCDDECAADVAEYLLAYYMDETSSSESSESSESSSSEESSSSVDASSSTSDSSSSDESSSESSSSSSVIVEQPKGNVEQGQLVLADPMCSVCHVDNGDGTFGRTEFDANSLEFADEGNYELSEAGLALYIEAEMPLGPQAVNCVGDCALDAAAYIWSFRDDAASSSSSESSSSETSSADSSDSSSDASSSSDSSSSSSEASSESSSSVVVVPSSSSSSSVSSADSSSSSSVVASSDSSSSAVSSSETSSSQESSSSSAATAGDPVAGASTFSEEGCVNCHADNEDGTFGAGIFGFDVNALVFAENGTYELSEAGLAAYIAAEMPPYGGEASCVDDCALDTAAYLWSLREDATSSSSSVESSSSESSASSDASSNSDSSSDSSVSSEESSSSESSSSVVVVPSSSSVSSESSESSSDASVSSDSSVSSSSSSVSSESSSSSAASESSSSEASSSSSSTGFEGDPIAGADVLASGNCVGCHTEQADGTFSPYAISVNDFGYPNLAKYADYSADSVEDVALFIEDNMQKIGTCVGQCAADAAAYLWSLRDAVSSSSNSSESSSDASSDSSSSDSSSSESSSEASSSQESSESSSVASSSDSSSSSTSSSTGFVGDPLEGASILAGSNCSGCHGQTGDVFEPYPINVNNFAYPDMAKYAGYTADSVDDLALFIEDNMQHIPSCVDQCAADAAAYLWSLRGSVGSSSSSSSVDTTASLSKSLTGDNPLTAPSTDELVDNMLALFDKDSIDEFIATLEASGFDMDELSVVFGAIGDVGMAMGGALANSVAPDAIEDNGVNLNAQITDVGFVGKNFAFDYDDLVSGVTVGLDVEFDFPTAGPSGASSEVSSTLILQNMSLNVAKWVSETQAMRVTFTPADGVISGSVKAVLETAGPIAVTGAGFGINLGLLIEDLNSGVTFKATIVGTIGDLVLNIAEDGSTDGHLNSTDLNLDLSADGLSGGASSSTSSFSESSSSVASSVSSDSSESSVSSSEISSSESSVESSVSSSSESSVESSVSSSSVVSSDASSSVSSSSETSSSSSASVATVSISKSLMGDNPLDADSTSALGENLLALFGQDDIDAFMQSLSDAGLNRAALDEVIAALGEAGVAMGGALANSVAPGSLEDNGVALNTSITDVGFVGKNFAFLYDSDISGVDVDLDVEFDFPTAGPSGSTTEIASTLILQSMSVNVAGLTASNGIVTITVLPTDGVLSGSLKAVLGTDDTIQVAGAGVGVNLGLIIEDVSAGITVNASVKGSIGDLAFNIEADGSTNGHINSSSLQLDATADGVGGGSSISSSSSSISSSASSVSSVSSSSSSVVSTSSSSVSSQSSSSSSASLGDAEIDESLIGEHSLNAESVSDLGETMLALFNEDAVNSFMSGLQDAGFNQAEFSAVGAALGEVGIAMGAVLANSVAPGSIEDNGIALSSTITDVGFVGKNFAFEYQGDVDGVTVDLDAEFDFPTAGPSGQSGADVSTLILQSMQVNISKLVASNGVIEIEVQSTTGVISGSIKADLYANGSVEVAGAGLSMQLPVLVRDLSTGIEVQGSLYGSLASVDFALDAEGGTSGDLTGADLYLKAGALGASIPVNSSSSSSSVSSSSSSVSSSVSSSSSSSSVAPQGDAANGQSLYGACQGCHGVGGRGGNNTELAGYSAEQLAGGWDSGPMGNFFAKPSDQDLLDISAYLGSQ